MAQHRRKLEGRGPTPKAEDRVYHKAYKAKNSKTSKPAQARATSHGQGAGPDWVVGRNPVLEALQAGLPVKAAYVAEGSERDDRLREIFKYAAEHSISLLQATRGELDRLTGGAVHQGVAMQLPGYDYIHPDDLLAAALDDDSREALVVALDGITDPHNLGAIVRSAAAFGAHGVVIPERRSASVTAVAWKSSAGAIARVPVARATNLNRTLGDFAKAGFTVVGLAGEGDTDIAEAPALDGPVVLVVGSEGDGLSRLTREHCDVLARIPIASTVESLNASVAASVALYEIARNRG
ncbi:23S rRNA (guanosine(2251)-2'-O)-methyltransferase RlmB [Brooklawnia cerclae]|uniref:23S rRNA (Guanosine2251-2'-O)-methyltransferase n=1 Tax=Brooklawnia cerclae TaxID=349934 RepID=A0ABX0SJ73_9ACTN|nr:23S rRNA (guanosine2251-2'-O)-methyltransferase [Brooklawnia cerclae]